MCGIFGITSTHPLSDKHVQDSANALELLHHRGPDGYGNIRYEKAILAHRRLSIIDTSSSANQPFTDIKNKVSVVANGEIYNFKKLRQELVVKYSAKFQSNSDCEVILHGYIAYGEKFFSSLEGMFSIALYDDRNQTLYLCRDRLGIKPLFYCFENGELTFCSETKPLRAVKTSHRLSQTTLQKYFLFGQVPQDQCLENDLQQLRPGYLLKYSQGKIDLERYWNLPEPKVNLDKSQILENVKSLLINSLERHLVADVPLGIFLSGGIDSTSVLALARQVEKEDIRTISIGFDVGRPQLNELSVAKKIAQYFNTDHTEHILNGNQVANEIDKIIYFMSSPSFDGINTYFVSKLTRELGIKVALSGLGGDEVFGGYEIFSNKMLKIFEHPKLASLLLKKSASLIPFAFSPSRKSKALRFQNVKDPTTVYQAVRLHSTPNELSNILTSHFLLGDVSGDFIPIHTDTLWSDIQKNEFSFYMGQRLLADTDAMSMANSIEVRVPLLDDNLVHFVFSLSDRIKKDFGFPKKLLTSALCNILPPFVLNLPKQGFSLPMNCWMDKELKEQIFDNLINKSNCVLPWNKKYLLDLYDKITNESANYDLFWKFYVLERWCQIHQISF